MRKEGRAMKKFLFLGIGSALMFTMGGVGPAAADAGPHGSTQVAAGDTTLVSIAGGGRCASCHRAHTAKAEYLLKDSQPALCYTCHGGSAASLDVIDGVNNDDSLALRGGGFEFALINGATATKTMGPVPVPDPITGITPRQAHSATAPAGTVPAVVTSRHQIDGTTSGTMWGNGAVSAAVNPGKAGVTLECGSCHDPHGNGNYRILKPIPNDSGAAVAVNIPDAITKVYTTNDYWLVRDPNVPLVKGGTATCCRYPGRLRCQRRRVVHHVPHALPGPERLLQDSSDGCCWCCRCNLHVSSPLGVGQGKQPELHPVPRLSRHECDHDQPGGLVHGP